MTRRGTLIDLALLAAVLAVYAALSLPQLELPGLYYDEAVDAIPAMQLVERQSTRVAPRGVSGSLSEMGLPDIVQILRAIAASTFTSAIWRSHCCGNWTHMVRTGPGYWSW